MAEYTIYLECGPQQRKTMVHVLDLLGCIAKGATMEVALEGTPPAIRAFHEFEAHHSSHTSSPQPITYHIAEHVKKGPWLGYGDPVSGFTPDFADLTIEDLNTYVQRLKWMEEDVLHLVEAILFEERGKNLLGDDRPVNAILVNLAEGHAGFLRYLLGKMEEISNRIRIIRRDPVALLPTLAQVWDIANERLAGMSHAERSQRVQHGQVTWTARRALRRMLEHTWDLYTELTKSNTKITG
jgi:predicted RNase H-like HicB family nuclease